MPTDDLMRKAKPIETIHSAFLDCRKSVYGLTALHPIQAQEIERMFTAGAYWALIHMTAEISSLPDDEAMEAIQKLLNEGEAFGKKVWSDHVSRS